MKVLGIETSCDETAIAVVDGNKKILSNLVLSQLEEHKAFGGVVPEIAARAHLDHIDRLISGAMQDAGVSYEELAGVELRVRGTQNRVVEGRIDLQHVEVVTHVRASGVHGQDALWAVG